jgi:hypothetical protein
MQLGRSNYGELIISEDSRGSFCSFKKIGKVLGSTKVGSVVDGFVFSQSEISKLHAMKNKDKGKQFISLMNWVEFLKTGDDRIVYLSDTPGFDKTKKTCMFCTLREDLSLFKTFVCDGKYVATKYPSYRGSGDSLKHFSSNGRFVVWVGEHNAQLVYNKSFYNDLVSEYPGQFIGYHGSQLNGCFHLHVFDTTVFRLPLDGRVIYGTCLDAEVIHNCLKWLHRAWTAMTKQKALFVSRGRFMDLFKPYDQMWSSLCAEARRCVSICLYSLATGSIVINCTGVEMFSEVYPLIEKAQYDNRIMSIVVDSFYNGQILVHSQTLCSPKITHYPADVKAFII